MKKQTKKNKIDWYLVWDKYRDDLRVSFLKNYDFELIEKLVNEQIENLINRKKSED